MNRMLATVSSWALLYDKPWEPPRPGITITIVGIAADGRSVSEELSVSHLSHNRYRRVIKAVVE